MRVRNKAEFYQLWSLGRFGNRLRSWTDLKSYEEGKYTGAVGLRFLQPGKRMIELKGGKALVRKHFVKGVHVICEAASDDRLTIQGEIQLSAHCGYDLRYSTVQGYRMPEGLARFQLHVTGLNALCHVRTRMDPSSWDDLQGIFTDFPGAVVEFSCYEMSVGNCDRNTIFWEVRTDY